MDNCDNGIGIAPQFFQQIFGVFNRLHKTGEYPGTGVGLAIVKKALERMGGNVGVESEEGVGSRFWIELKIERLRASDLISNTAIRSAHDADLLEIFCRAQIIGPPDIPRIIRGA